MTSQLQVAMHAKLVNKFKKKAADQRKCPSYGKLNFWCTCLFNRIRLTRLNAWPTIWPANVRTKELFFLTELTVLLSQLLSSEDQSQDNLTVRVPDTITSWVASAYALSERDGLGIAHQTELTAIQAFFVTLKLPYSVMRGETLQMLVSVFNYIPGCMQVSNSHL